MRSSQRWIFSWALAGAWVLGAGVEVSAAKAEADSLFQAAMGQVGRVPDKESLRAFEHVLKADWNYAPAHHEMAKLYMSLNTPVDRQRARDALDRALKLDLENAMYQMTLGDLLWTQGLWLEAREQYEKVLKAHPDNARAAYGIGYYALKDFMKYQNMTGGIGLNRFSEKDREKAISYLERSIELNSAFRDAYYQLGVVYVESRQPVKLIGLAEQLLKQYPGDKDALLFCALGYQTTGNPERAYALYTEAIKQMASEERAMMESVDLIATKEEQKQIGQAVVPRQEGDSSKSWLDSPERDGFWRKQDPLFLSKFNERRMEHYSRVAYANLRFSHPSKGISGWQTDMGSTWIKFGRYVHRTRPFSDLREAWFYEDFQIGFKSDFIDIETLTFGGMGGLDVSIGEVDLDRGLSSSPVGVGTRLDRGLGPPSGGTRTRIENEIAEFFRPPPHHVWLPPYPKPRSRDVFKETPPRYVDPYRDKKWVRLFFIGIHLVI